MIGTRHVVALVGVAAAAGLAVFATSTRSSRADASPRVIDGAGATLPFPLYAKWSSELARVDGTLRINYQPLGSGAGIRQMADGVIDFGATEEPLSDAQLEDARRDLVHVPMTIGAVVLAYNVPGVAELKLTPDVIADVFRGAITCWDDPRLREANASTTMPSKPITVVHRADGSGTSATLTTYLARNSEAWRTEVGLGVSPRFPVGIGARGSEGVTAYVKSTPFAIGYVELTYAKQASLPIALVKNRAGNFVAPTIESLDRAAKSALGRVPDDLRVSLVDAEDPGAYPITALSFLVLPRDSRERAKGEALARFAWWGLHDGQRYAAALEYAPLPRELVVRAERVVRELRAGGEPVHVTGGGNGG
jgi:phosphate transport system substrate-binding protein